MKFLSHNASRNARFFSWFDCKAAEATNAVSLGEMVVLSLILLVCAGSLLYGMQTMIVADLDEGVYLVAGKLITEGKLPYRDFLLAHPPLLAWISAAAWQLSASVMTTRILAVFFTLATCVPLYLLQKRLTLSRLAGLLTCALYVAGLVWMSGLGRTMRLEPLMNLLVVWGWWLWIARRGPLATILAGLAFAAAIATKLNAVVPIGLLAIAELLWPAFGAAHWRRRVLLGISAGIALLALFGWCVQEPGFHEWVFKAQLSRPPNLLHERLTEIATIFGRFLLFPLGLASAAVMLVRGRKAVRPYALAALGICLAMAFAFRSFFGYYLVIGWPWALVVLVDRAWQRPSLRRLALPLTLLAALSPIAFTEMIFLMKPERITGPSAIAKKLQLGHGPILTSAPILALWTGRPLFEWYYEADNYLPRVTGRLIDHQFAEALTHVSALVLSPSEAYMAQGGFTAALLRSDFSPMAVPPPWVAWERVKN